MGTTRSPPLIFIPNNLPLRQNSHCMIASPCPSASPISLPLCATPACSPTLSAASCSLARLGQARPCWQRSELERVFLLVANLFSQAVAARFQTTFFNVRCSSLASKWRGDSEKLIRILFQVEQPTNQQSVRPTSLTRISFQLARHNAPATVFLDEADALLSERGTAQEHEVTEDLPQQ